MISSKSITPRNVGSHHLEVHVALVGALGTINPPVVGVTVRCSKGRAVPAISEKSFLGGEKVKCTCKWGPDYVIELRKKIEKIPKSMIRITVHLGRGVAAARGKKKRNIITLLGGEREKDCLLVISDSTPSLVCAGFLERQTFSLSLYTPNASPLSFWQSESFFSTPSQLAVVGFTFSTTFCNDSHSLNSDVTHHFNIFVV